MWPTPSPLSGSSSPAPSHVDSRGARAVTDALVPDVYDTVRLGQRAERRRGPPGSGPGATAAAVTKIVLTSNADAPDSLAVDLNGALAPVLALASVLADA